MDHLPLAPKAPGLDPILAPVATGAEDKGGSDDTEMTENRISLSVVIPFYKDEVYVEDAVVSALSQPIADLEVIVVNDNPGPESGAFLAAMQERHEFRVVTHEVNRGLSAARNTGIEAARGDYLTFIDADDIFISGALAENLKFAVANGADITHAPTMLLPVEAVHPIPLRRDQLLFGHQIAATTLKETPAAQYIVSSWSSIYRREWLLAKAVRFDEEQRRFEDRLFVLDAVFAAEKIAFSGIPARIWRRRLGSITTGEREMADLAMQLDLITKCIASARRAADKAGEMVLQRELHHSICRVINDVKAGEIDPATSPELDAARARVSAAMKGLELKKSVFADLSTMIISPLDRLTRNHGPVSRKMLLEAYALVAAGDWEGLYRWRKGHALPAPGIPKPLDMELILHIGLHKTGTTFLQRALEQDRERLKSLGILVPKTGFLAQVGDNRRGAATPGHVGFYGALRQGREEIFDQLREECAASGCERVVISAENLSFPLQSAADRAWYLKRAEAGFGFFPRRKVIAVYRRPDEYVDRYWREHVFLANGWSRRTAEQFAAEFGAQMTDLGFLTGDWREFAGGNTTLISYEGAKGEGLLARFYREIGAPLPEQAPEDVVYPSPRAEQAVAARMIALSHLTPKAKAHAYAEFLQATAHLPSARGYQILARKTRLRLIAEFEARSLPFLRQYGLDAPLDEWRESTGPEPGAIHPGYMEAAMAAISAASSGGFEPVVPRPGLRLYRYGRGLLNRL